jgi:hypothetical protein
MSKRLIPRSVLFTDNNAIRNYSRVFALTFLTAILVCLHGKLVSADEASDIPEDVHFLIGSPDAFSAEFGLASDAVGYNGYLERFGNEGIVYTIGESEPTDWPYMHPAPRDPWADNRVHPFTIRYDISDNGSVPNGPTYLVLGTNGTWTGTPVSTIVITVNGKNLPGRLVTGRPSNVFSQPHAKGVPHSMTFELPPGSLQSGMNEITIRLEDGTWILYDYVALRDKNEPLELIVPPTLPRPAWIDETLSGPMNDVEEIVYAVRKTGSDGHWYANFGYYAFDENIPLYREGGALRKLNVKTGQVITLLEDPTGAVRDPVVHYDGEKILFSYRPGGTEFYHLYEIDIDGSNLRQLTDGKDDDFEPTYLPEGDILFISSRCNRWVNCWLTKVAVLYRCGPDGENIQALSSNIEHDNTPWVLPSGQFIYTRWEYVDRSQVNYHHLWISNPDGTRQTIFFGNMNPGITMIDAKSIPNSRNVVVSFSPGHGRKEHAGAITVLDPRDGPDHLPSAHRISTHDNHRDPWAFSETSFMAALNHKLQLINGQGEEYDLLTLSEEERAAGMWIHEPRPVIRREREIVVPDQVEWSRETGQLMLVDIYQGRNMEGVERGEIKKLLILETLPKPVNFTGGMDPLTYAGSFTLERVLGTVPVEEDGSAYIELPALRSFFFVALDENDLSVKRMQSFLSVMPGETTTCIGCHEQRTETPSFNPAQFEAFHRAPSQIEPVLPIDPNAEYRDVFDFPRDVQPILDRLCVDCHGYETTERGGPIAGNVILEGDRGPMFSHAYFEMTIHKLFSDGRNQPVSNYAPRTLGSGASKILTMLDGSHYDVLATEQDFQTLRLWIEVGAPYPGTYAALGCGSIGGYQQNNLVETDFDWPETKAASEAITRRCDGCHSDNFNLPKALSDEHGLSFWQPSMDDPRLETARHIVFNLSRPEYSLMLLAPLSKEAGGYGTCRPLDADASDPDVAFSVFENTDDPDYQAILAMCQAGRDRLDEMKRFDMPDFIPRSQYKREMIHYGILPEDHDPSTPVDYYQLDQDYWESLWHRRTEGHR